MSFSAPSTSPYLETAAGLRAVFARDAAIRDQEGGRPVEQIRQLREAGLLTIQIPAEYGGAGEPWSTVLRITRELSRTDGSLGHLYGYHFNALNSAAVRGSPQQRESILTASARHAWFWGNSGNSFSRSLFGRREGKHWVLNGHCPFSSGTHVADRIVVAWEDEATDERMFAAVEADRLGITVLDDWDGIGQRQTGSGTVTYNNVRVHESEVLDTRHNEGQAFASLGPQLQQSVLLNVFIGSAQGALDEARAYTTTKSRPWIHSGVERHVDDPWIQRVYGELYTKTQAATLLADQALDAVDLAWAKGKALTDSERGEAAIAIATANAFAGEVALDVTSRIFEVMGARSSDRAYGYDRFWRNVRTHTLHNPAEYKTRTVGTWFLTGAYPEPSVFR